MTYFALLRMAKELRRTPIGPCYFRSLSSASTTSQDSVDVLVIGGGPGGYVAAIKAAQLGLKTACVEMRGTLGGTCLNVGCIPSKSLLHSSHMYHDAKTSFQKHGIKVSGLEVDLDQMMKAKSSAVQGLTQGIEHLFKKNGVKYLKGKGELKSLGQATIHYLDGSSAAIGAKHIILATGSEPTSLPGLDFDEETIVSSTGALALKTIPKKMAVIGGGVIGLEMGSVWSRLGAEVTVIEFLPNVVPSMDGDIRKAFQRTLTKQGIKFKMETKVTKATKTKSGVSLSIEGVKSGKAESLDCDVVLVSTGRKPYTDGLGLKSVGVATDDKGRVVVDSNFATNVPGVYAIGDIIHGPMLAHKAEEDGIACVETIAGRAGHVNYDTVPNIVYTFPELATVGLTEEQCKEGGFDYNVGKFPLTANSRAKTNDQAEGLVKGHFFGARADQMIANKKDDKVLGVHIIAPGAGELIGEAVLAMEYGASSEDIARVCHGHPTISEALKEAAMATYDKPIHM